MSISNSERVTRLISKLEKWIRKRRDRGLEFVELAEAVRELRVLRTFYLVRETKLEEAQLHQLDGEMRKVHGKG